MAGRLRVTTARTEDRLDAALGLGLRTLPVTAPAVPPVSLPALPVAGSLNPVTSALGLLAGSLTATVQSVPAARRAGLPTGSLLPRPGLVRTATAGHRDGSGRRLGLPPTPGPNPADPAGIPPTGGCTNAGASITMTVLAPGDCVAASPAGLADRTEPALAGAA